MLCIVLLGPSSMDFRGIQQSSFAPPRPDVLLFWGIQLSSLVPPRRHSSLDFSGIQPSSLAPPGPSSSHFWGTQLSPLLPQGPSSPGVRSVALARCVRPRRATRSAEGQRLAHGRFIRWEISHCFGMSSRKQTAWNFQVPKHPASRICAAGDQCVPHANPCNPATLHRVRIALDNPLHLALIA